MQTGNYEGFEPKNEKNEEQEQAAVKQAEGGVNYQGENTDTPALDQPEQPAEINYQSESKNTLAASQDATAAPAEPAEDKTPAALATQGFKLIKALKSGVSGDVALYEYHGNDPAIKALLHNNVLLIKTPRVNMANLNTLTNSELHALGTAKNEMNLIESHLGYNSDNPPAYRPKMMVLNIGAERFILNECIFAN